MNFECNKTFFSDGFTKDDVIYVWKVPQPVQFANNLFMPGGFVLYGTKDGSCDIETATGMCITCIFVQNPIR